MKQQNTTVVLTGAMNTRSETDACAAIGWTAGQLRIAVYAKRTQPDLVVRFTRASIEVSPLTPTFAKTSIKY